MNDWSHGYDVSAGYTYGFRREMAPDWLDLSAMLAGQAPGRAASGAPFRYLELGCGQGMGLCLLAAANPHGEFFGVDFLPDHIAHARAVAAAAGLTNVHFSDGDFMVLADDWPRDFGQFDYVTLHGVYSWITPSIRAALIRCLAHATAPGGLVYIGYNAQPGWIGTMPFRHISRLMKESGDRPGDAVMGDSIALFDRLAAGGASTFQMLPGLKARLASVKQQPVNYLIHEYLHEGWHPLWHSEVAKEVASAGLGFVGTAALAETLLPGALPPPLRAAIADQDAPTLRVDVQDFVINQAFRRDIFRPLPSAPAADGQIDDALLHLLETPQAATLDVKTSFGEITLQRPAFAQLVNALADGPRTIAALTAQPDMRAQGKANAIQILALLLHARILGTGPAMPSTPQAAERLNRIIARGVAEGLPYDHLAAAALGSAVAARDIDLLLLDSWFEAPTADAAALAQAVAARLAQLDRPVTDNGQTLTGDAAHTRLAALSATFLEQGLPRWRQLGVLA